MMINTMSYKYNSILVPEWFTLDYHPTIADLQPSLKSLLINIVGLLLGILSNILSSRRVRHI